MSKNIDHKRRSSEPHNQAGNIMLSSRKNSDDATSTSNKNKSSIKNNAIYKSMFVSKKKQTDNIEHQKKKLTSSSSEVETQNRESFFSREKSHDLQISSNTPLHVYTNNDLLLHNQDELSDELNIKFDLKITCQGKNIITTKTYIIEKNNSHQLIAEQFNSIFKTGLGFYVLKQISLHKDHNSETPIRIIYQKQKKHNLDNSSFQMTKKININDQGFQVISNTNFDLNDLKSSTNGEAVIIKITSPQGSPEINTPNDINLNGSYIDISEISEISENISSLNTSNSSSILLSGQTPDSVIEI
ncbi:MAG: hypothetical protein EKK61_02480 [Rickettsiales bacterium]|nr:MAG: hypothetical protein EKK61_02480 [Rickettsiales bacterium]